MRGIVFYTICIGFASGIFVRSFFDFGGSIITVFLLISVATMFMWRRKKKEHASPLFLSSVFFLVCSMGMFRMDVADTKESVLVPMVEQQIEFFGRVSREPEERASSVHFYITPIVKDVLLKERVLVTADRFSFAESNIEYGDIVRIRGKLSLPEAFESDGGRIFDYPGYLRVLGVHTVMYNGAVTYEREGDSLLLTRIYASKARFMELLESILPQPHAGLAEGMLLGVKRALSDSLDEAFRKTGTIHIVVLSGYNVMIVVEVLLYVLAYFCVRRTRVWIGIGGIVLFALLVGMSATVVRASIMAGLLLMVRGTGRTYTVLRGLGLAGVVMLLINPHLLVHDPGFQLSFLATFGLIVFSPYFEKKLTAVPEQFGMRGIITATIATQVVVLPLLLHHTGMLSVVSVVVNALILPMVPIAMLLTFATGMAGLILPFLGNVLGYITYLSLSYILGIVTWFASLPYASATVTQFPFWIVVVAYIGMALWFVTRMSADDHGLTEGEYDDWTIVAEDSLTLRQPGVPISRTSLRENLRHVQNDYEGWVIEEKRTP